ncbi:MAG: aminoacyl-tRNA hydrolase [candidate division WOR-3 bacterium]
MIFFGLGNPGIKYLMTRHNLGFMFLDFFALHHNLRFKKMFNYALARGVVMNTEVILCKPLCFMNNSGIVVRHILNAKFPRGYNEDSFLVICDDLNLDLGRTKLYKKGTDGGHLGLRSIIETLDTISFMSLRLGIGQPPGIGRSEYVLANFTENELIVVRQMLDRALEGIHLLLTRSFEAAQTFLNTRNIKK